MDLRDAENEKEATCSGRAGTPSGAQATQLAGSTN